MCVCVAMSVACLLGPLLSSSYRSGNCWRFAPGHTFGKNSTQGANLASALTVRWPGTDPQVEPPGECSWSGQTRLLPQGREQTLGNRKLIFPNMITSREAVISRKQTQHQADLFPWMVPCLRLRLAVCPQRPKGRLRKCCGCYEETYQSLIS